MNKKQIGLQIIFWGSVWGLQEVLIDTFCYYNKAIPRSILLGVSAIFILAVATQISDDKYLAAKIGAMAAFYKFLNILFFPCQFFAVILFGMVYNVQAALAKKMNVNNLVLRGMFVVAGLLVFNAIFGLSMTYLFKYKYWVEGGNEKLLNFLFIESSFTALFGFFGFLLGDKLGRVLKPNINYLATQQSKIYTLGTAGFSSLVLVLMFIL